MRASHKGWVQSCIVLMVVISNVTKGITTTALTTWANVMGRPKYSSSARDMMDASSANSVKVKAA